VLLSSWAATRDGGVTSWLSCDEADADPVRFWTGFIQAPQAVAPGFGADAAELLAMDGVHLHDYGKEPRPGRKLGHCTVVASSPTERDRSLRRLLGPGNRAVRP